MTWFKVRHKKAPNPQPQSFYLGVLYSSLAMVSYSFVVIRCAFRSGYVLELCFATSGAAENQGESFLRMGCAGASCSFTGFCRGCRPRSPYRLHVGPRFHCLGLPNPTNFALNPLKPKASTLMRPVLQRSVRREGTAELPPAEEIEAGLDIAMLFRSHWGSL